MIAESLSGFVWIISIFLIALVVIYSLRGYFLLNDITTTFDHVPEFNKVKLLPENAGKDLHFDESNVNLHRKFYPELKPLEFSLSVEELFQLVLNNVKKTSWTIVNVDLQKNLIEATATTGLLHFHDDVVIEVRPSQKGSSLNMRSKSRVGKGDLGTNARRIRDFYKFFPSDAVPQ